MNLLKWMLATALVLDAALMLTGTVNAESSSPDQTVGYTVDSNSNSSIAYNLNPTVR
jgi:hypothetical protein